MSFLNVKKEKTGYSFVISMKEKSVVSEQETFQFPANWDLFQTGFGRLSFLPMTVFKCSSFPRRWESQYERQGFPPTWEWWLREVCLFLIMANPKNWVATQNDNRKQTFHTSLLIAFFLLFTFSSFGQVAKRVVSLAPSITENIYLIGGEDRLVGCTSFCTQAVADGVQQVGSTVEVNIEKILTLRPDLVITMLMTKPQDVETLRKLGIRVEVMPSPKNFDEICEQTLLIAKWLGHENVAQQVVSKAKHTVDSLKQLSLQKPSKPDIFFQLGASPVFTVLDNTFMNDFILMCHGDNIFNGLNKGIVTRESVLLKNPDVIIIATMGGYGENEQKVWQSYKGLKAAENKRIFLIDSETACSPTPANFVSALTDVYKFVN